MDILKVNRVAFREHETFLKSFSDGPKRGKGQLFLEIDLPDNPGAEDAIVEKIWRALHDSFYNSESDDAYFTFEESLKAVNEVIEKENQKRERGTIGRIHAVAALIQEKTLHFSHTGHAAVYLQRNQQFTEISEELEPDAESSFNSISSGELHSDDHLIFTTRSLPFDDQTLLQVFSEKDGKMISQLKGLGKQKEVTGAVTAIIFPNKMSVQPSFEKTPLSEESDVSAPQEEPLAENRRQILNKVSSERAQKALQMLKNRFDPKKLENIKKTFRGVVDGVGSRLSKVIKKPERLKNVNRRYVMMTVIGLVAFLAILLIFQSDYRQKAQQAEYYEDLLHQVENNIAIADQRNMIENKQSALEFLNNASTSLQEIETAGFFKANVEKLKKQILDNRDSFDQIFRVTEPNVFFDLSQKGTVDALGMIHTQDQKNFVYEPRRLFESVLDKVQEALAIDPEEIVLSGAELEDFNVLAFVTQNGQIIEYSTRNGKFERSKTQDEAWKKGVDIKTFNGDLMYLLDPSANSIWKYRRLRTGYSTSTIYSDQGELSNAISMTIDGDVYVLLRDGTIVKYRKGVVTPFEIKNQPAVPLNSPTRIFTLPEAKRLYVLDSANRRIVVYSKGTAGVSQYERQVVFDTLKPNEILDFYVDKDEQKLVTLTADKAYITDL
jgi:tetratricopeptide (TPR) repeat protein